MSPRFFPFLQLPVEIRLPIYRIALPYSEYHDELSWERNDCPVEWYRGVCPEILYVNRQIHREASQILYEKNAFAIYIKHPRAARLPMNESRPDPESFMLFSWSKKSFSHPQNPRLPYPLLVAHQNIPNIRRLHISLPPFDDLAGVDMYMKKASYAAFNGINAWIRKCTKADLRPDDQEWNRMEYIKPTKDPIDQVGELLETLSRLDQLCLSFQARDVDITFTEYLLEGILTKVRNVSNVRCFYVPVHEVHRPDPWNYGNPDYLLLQKCAMLLQSAKGTNMRQSSHLPSKMDRMYWLLQSIRTKQERDPSAVPDWLSPMFE